MSVNKHNSTWWRPLIAASALTALAVTPFLFASGIDNDSPFNMPNWGTLCLTAGPSADGRYANVLPLSIGTETGSTIQLVDHLLPKSRLRIDHVKVCSPAQHGGESASTGNHVERLLAVSGSEVRLIDSAPLVGSTTVSVQGRFWVSGPALLGLELGGLFKKPVSFLVIGSEDPTTHRLTSVQQILPLGYTSGILDIQKLAKTLAEQPTLEGATALLVCGHVSTSMTGTPQVALDATVQFQVSKAPLFLIDTDAKLPK